MVDEPDDCVLLPSGCELLVRGPSAGKQGSNPVKIVQTAIDLIRKSDEDLDTIPLVVKPFSIRGDWAPAAYVLLDSHLLNSVPGNSDEPCTDLLDLWKSALTQHDKSWEVVWSPAAHGTDKQMWVRFPDLRCRRSFVFETNYYLGFTGDRL